jgi:hypothetical protein
VFLGLACFVFFPVFCVSGFFRGRFGGAGFEEEEENRSLVFLGYYCYYYDDSRHSEGSACC